MSNETAYYHVRFGLRERHEYVLDVRALDLFLYYVHPLAMNRSIYVNGLEVWEPGIYEMQIVKTDYSIRLRAETAEVTPEQWALSNRLWDIEPDVTPHIRMYYGDSPMRRRIDDLLEELRDGEVELAEAGMDDLPKIAQEVEERRNRASEAIGMMIGAMLRGYVGP